MDATFLNWLRLKMPDQAHFLAALAVLDMATLATEVQALARTLPPVQLHDLCVEANRISRNPNFRADVRNIRANTRSPSKYKFKPEDLPQVKTTTPAYRNTTGEVTFQQTPYILPADQVRAWRVRRGTDPEAQKDRWNPRPERANAYDRTKLRPHKARFS